MVVFVALQSAPAFVVASVAVVCELPRLVRVSAEAWLEAALVARVSLALASVAQFAWQASVVVAFVGAGAAGAGVCRSQASG